MPAPAVSARDPRVLRAAALLREPADDVVALDGPELIEVALEEGLEVELVLASEAAAWEQVRAPVAAAAPDALRALGALGQPARVVAIVRLPPPPRGVPPGSLVLDGVRDAGNVGGIIRTAAGFSRPRVAVTPDTASPFSRRALRASMGAALRPGLVARIPSLDALAVPLAAAVPAGGLAPHELPADAAVVLGNERTGLSDAALAHCRHRVTIPVPGFESLNVAAAAAILAWELSR